MQITVKLAGPLRKKVSGLVNGEIQLELNPGTLVSQAIEELGLGGQVRMLILNGKALKKDKPLGDGDRLMLLPPALAFNMYVATGFLAPDAREQVKKGEMPS